MTSIHPRSAIKLSIHNTLKYAGVGSTVPADAFPNVHLHGVFRFRLVARFLSSFPTTNSAVCFHLKRGFIRPNYIIKVCTKVLLGRPVPIILFFLPIILFRISQSTLLLFLRIDPIILDYSYKNSTIIL